MGWQAGGLEVVQGTILRAAAAPKAIPAAKLKITILLISP